MVQYLFRTRLRINSFRTSLRHPKRKKVLPANLNKQQRLYMHIQKN